MAVKSPKQIGKAVAHALMRLERRGINERSFQHEYVYKKGIKAHPSWGSKEYSDYLAGVKENFKESNPTKKAPKGWVKAKAVKISRKAGKVVIQIKK